MSFTHKPGHGSLFKNDRKESDKHPDYKGSVALPDGSLLEVAGWLKDGQRGKYLSLKVQPPRERQEAPAPQAQTRPAYDLDDEIPF